MSQKLTVFYDGLCVLCSREIDHYRKQQGAENILFSDITSPDFKAKDWGVDPFLVHKHMHARRSDGSLATHVDAFIEIWKVLPRYQWAARAASKGIIRPFLDAGYLLFAKVRPWLPRRKQLCADSPYCEIQQKEGL